MALPFCHCGAPALWSGRGNPDNPADVIARCSYCILLGCNTTNCVRWADAFDAAGAAAAAQTAAATYTDAAVARVSQAAQPLAVVSRLTVAATRTATTYAGTGLSVPVVAGKAYRIQAAGQYRTAALTTGIGFRLGGTATATGVRYQTFIHGLTATTFLAQAQSALGVTAAFSTAVAVANTDYPWQIDGFIRVANAGTITVDFAAEVASSTVTVQPDAYLLLETVP